eukprot:scaffold11739_cov129-Isochrysis_galbana.AAC.7
MEMLEERVTTTGVGDMMRPNAATAESTRGMAIGSRAAWWYLLNIAFSRGGGRAAAVPLLGRWGLGQRPGMLEFTGIVVGCVDR